MQNRSRKGKVDQRLKNFDLRRNSGSKELNFLRDARKSFAKMIGTGKKSGVSSNYEIILFSSVSVPMPNIYHPKGYE